MPNLLAFQHVPHEKLGSFEKNFLAQGWRVSYVESFRSDLVGRRLSDFGPADAVIVLGGPMSANDELTFIREELRLIEEVMKQNMPFLGICLGSQLLAKALGSKVYRGEKKEIGWYPLELDAAAGKDSLLKEWPTTDPMFQWHGETFELPRGAERLASSALYPNQAFRYGRNIYGFQFHPEMTAGMVEEWLKEGQDEIAAAGLPHDAARIREDTKKNIESLDQRGQKVIEAFVKLSDSNFESDK